MIAVRASGTRVYDPSASTQSVVRPTGTLSGDVMVAIATGNWNTTAGTIAVPSGWNQVALNITSLKETTTVCWRLSTGADGPWTFATAGGTGTARIAVAVQTFSGVDSVTAVDVAATPTTNVLGTTITTATMTVVTGGAWEVIAVGNLTAGAASATGFTALDSVGTSVTAHILWNVTPKAPGLVGAVTVTMGGGGAQCVPFSLRPQVSTDRTANYDPMPFALSGHALTATLVQQASLAATPASDAFAGPAGTATASTLARTAAGDTPAGIAGTIAGSTVARTEAHDVSAAAAGTAASATSARTESADASAVAAGFRSASVLARTETDDVASGTSYHCYSTTALAEAHDDAAGTARTVAGSVLAPAESHDDAAAIAGYSCLATADVAAAGDLAFIPTTAATGSTLDYTAASDAASDSTMFESASTLARTETGDTADVGTGGNASVAHPAFTESHDTCAIETGIATTFVLAGTEAGDACVAVEYQGWAALAAEPTDDAVAAAVRTTCELDRIAIVDPGAVVQVLRSRPTRIHHVSVTAAGSGTGHVLFYDGTDTSGTVIAAIPGTVSAGAFFRFVVPTATGLTVLNVVDGPGLTIGVD